ncbi:unnamed protein product [Camellia sinensis]
MKKTLPNSSSRLEPSKVTLRYLSGLAKNHHRQFHKDSNKVRIAIAIAISPLHLLQWWLGLPQLPSPRVVVPVEARGHRPPLHNLAINPPPNLLHCLLSSPRTPHQCQAGNHLRLVSEVFHQYLATPILPLQALEQSLKYNNSCQNRWCSNNSYSSLLHTCKLKALSFPFFFF